MVALISAWRSWRRPTRAGSFGSPPVATAALRSGISPAGAVAIVRSSAWPTSTFCSIESGASMSAAAPASSAFCLTCSRLAARSGASSTSPTTRPACRAPTDQVPLEAWLGPRREASVSAGMLRPIPSPQRASAALISTRLGSGSSAMATRPAASSSAPPATAARGALRRATGAAASAPRGSRLTRAAASRGGWPHPLIISTTDRNSAPTRAADSRASEAPEARRARRWGSSPTTAGAGAGTRTATVAASAARARGTCAMKIEGQSKTWVSAPPSAGPTAAPTTAAAPHSPAPRRRDPVRAARSGTVPARSSAAPTPCTVRAVTITARSPAIAQDNEASAKTTRPTRVSSTASRRRTRRMRPSATTATARL